MSVKFPKTILQGDPGLGKSTLALEIAARLSRNDPMPDGSLSDIGSPSGTVLLSAEDGLADTIRPRLDARNADQTRIATFRQNDLLIPRGVPRIKNAIEQVQARLLLLDPLAAFLENSVNSWNNQHVRRALTPLAKIAEDACAAGLIVDHLNKALGRSALYRGSGSIGIVGAARSVLLVGKHPNELDTFVLTTVKSNYGAVPPALRYRIEEAENKSARIVWLGPCDLKADDLVSDFQHSQEEGKREIAKQFLLERLAGGSCLSTVLDSEARSKCITQRTLNRAAGDLRIVKKPCGFKGQWVWSLPLAHIVSPIPEIATASRDGHSE